MQRIVAVPFGLRKLPADRIHLPAQRGRAYCAGEETQPCSFEWFLRPDLYIQIAQEIAPGLRFAPMGDGGRTIRIVEIQNGSLGKEVSRAQARAMLGIAFDLGGPIF